LHSFPPRRSSDLAFVSCARVSLRWSGGSGRRPGSADAGRHLRRWRLRQVERHGYALEPLHDAVLVAADVERAAKALGPDARVQIAGLDDESTSDALDDLDLGRSY